jgi:Holliday junction resolvase RusA-like endonuclease
MKTLAVRVCGIPKAQPRVKAFRRGDHAGVFDPGTADGWKLLVRHEAAKEWDAVKFEGAVHVELAFYMPRPKAHFGKNGLKSTAPTAHTGKPDLDNLEKAVLDALTQLGIWDDDSQVAVVTKCKCYSPHPGALIVVKDRAEMSLIATAYSNRREILKLTK